MYNLEGLEDSIRGKLHGFTTFSDCPLQNFPLRYHYQLFSLAASSPLQMQLQRVDYAKYIHVQRPPGPAGRLRKNNRFECISYSLILRHLLFILLRGFLDLLFHGVQRTRIHGIHLFLCLLFLNQSSIQGIFEVRKSFEGKWGNGFCNIALALHEA